MGPSDRSIVLPVQTDGIAYDGTSRLETINGILHQRPISLGRTLADDGCESQHLHEFIGGRAGFQALNRQWRDLLTVSYTHLTLPTKRIV